MQAPDLKVIEHSNQESQSEETAVASIRRLKSFLRPQLTALRRSRSPQCAEH
jgi:hypothetical protein